MSESYIRNGFADAVADGDGDGAGLAPVAGVALWEAAGVGLAAGFAAGADDVVPWCADAAFWRPEAIPDRWR